MEINQFLALFEQSLVKHGFSKEASHSHTVKVFKSLSPDSRKKIEKFRQAEDIGRFAEAYVTRLRKMSAAAADISRDKSADTQTVSKNFSGTINEEDIVYYAPRRQNDAKSAPKASKQVTVQAESNPANFASRTAQTATVQRNSDAIGGKTVKIDRIDIKASSKEPLSPEGRKEYIKRTVFAAIPASIGVCIMSLPVILGYILIALLIAFFIAVLVAVTVVGGVLTFAGIIYGVISLFGAVPEGIYEIGLALVILGATLALAISSYNIAVRLIPVIWRKYSSSVTKQLIMKLKLHLNRIRKECNGL